MEKLRIKLSTDQASTLFSFLYKNYKDLGEKRIIIDFNHFNDLSHYFLLGEICNRLNSIMFRGGRLSITPAEAVTIFKIFNNSSYEDQDIYVNHILQDIFNAVHKYLSDLL
jgi:hypothetical protein